MRILFYLLCLIVLSSHSVNGQTCRKYEENLTLWTVLKNKEKVSYYLDSLRNCGNDSPESILSLGRYLYHQNKYSDSDEILAILFSNPEKVSAEDLGEAYYYSGLNSYYLYKHDEAITLFFKSIDLGFKRAWCYNGVGLALSRKKEHHEALSYYTKALKEDPSYIVAINNIGYAYNGIGNPKLAMHYYTIADSSAKGSVALYRSNITRLLRDQEKYDLAMTSAILGFENFPDNKMVLYDMGNSLNNLQKHNEALFFGRKLLEKGPRSAEDWFDIAHLYDCAGKLDSAMYFYKLSLNLKPDYKNANHNSGIIYKLWGMFEKSHEHLNRALKEDPKDELIINSKIHTHLWEHDFENAYKWCERYNELYLGRKYSYLNTGYVLIQLKRYEEAIPWLEKKLIQNPKDDRALNNLGHCYSKLGDTDKALLLFNQALALNPENSFTYHNRASLYNDMGDYEKSCADLRISIEKEYNWIVDSSLIKMKEVYCPDINLNRKILLREYKGNTTALKNQSFIQLIDSLVDVFPLEYETILNLDPSEEDNKLSSSQNAFNIHPNPSSGIFSIERIMWDNEPLKLKVFDMQGREMGTLPMQDNKKTAVMNLSFLKHGAYIVMIINDKAVLSTQKIIIGAY